MQPGMKGPEILFPSCVEPSHRSDSSLLTSPVNSQFSALCALFFKNCEVMEFADMGHRSEECSDL